jgi:hypothetical protein
MRRAQRSKDRLGFFVINSTDSIDPSNPTNSIDPRDPMNSIVEVRI